MKRSFPFPRGALAASLGTAALVAACISERQSGTGPLNASGDCRIAVSGPIVGSTRALVAIRGFAFHPDTIHVKQGAQVTWLNCEETTIDAHTSTSASGVWRSTFIAPGENYTRTFSELGTFPFFCEPHPFMKGAVVVEP